eukprot:CAMPEP_0201480606 /NCGR_PEP_ID=MMETSP0151_2-20130828/5056_1 /ASSEMBLY_ACC=CAM_ASM_000257 /TAXON_ID=200890 /ORGANISM="Paramoeba atlantica, Strain 621/1 / CCAP 1560/9" /LENGTH=446 /DNA_ID=CAMNT_0047862519 /DNA_START=216 /DNA_END=1556 /DNA_ORIENTATION=-
MNNAVKTGHLYYFMENAKKYDHKAFQILGPGINIVSIYDPKHVEMLFSKEHFADYIKGEIFHDNFEEILGHGIFAVDGEQWVEKRKVSSYLFNTGSLRSQMSEVFLKHSHAVAEHLDSLGPSEVVDLQDLFAHYTFDSICTIAFGMEVNSLGGNERDVQFQKSYDFAQNTASARFIDPLWKIKRFFHLGDQGQFPSHVKVLDEYIYKVIKDRLESVGDGHQDMLSLYIEYGKKKGKEFDLRFLRDMVLNFIIAGRDTTAAASMWLIYEIAHNPHIEEPLLKEISENIGDAFPTYDNVRQMDYLKAVFYETLRLHPSVPLDGKFARTEKVLQPGNLKIPKDTLVQFNILGMNTDPSRWPEPEKFLPSRWLNEEGKFQEKSECEYATFNLKPRACLGKRMAELEAAVLMCVLLPRFKFKLKEGFVPKFATSSILFCQDGLQFHVSKRK